jgi:spore maturation protein CgeB
MDDDQLRKIARAARERVLDEHTSEHRARELIDMIQDFAVPMPMLMAGE